MMQIDVIESYFPGVLALNKIGLGTAIVGNYIYEYPELVKDIKSLFKEDNNDK